MEVKNASDIELTRSQKKNRSRSMMKRKARMEQEIGNGNAESKEEKGICLETENVRSDLGTEQSIPPRKKMKKMNGNNSSVNEKKSGCFLKEEANSSTKTLPVTDSNVRTLENTGSEHGPKEEPAGSETKRKRKRNKKNKQESPLVDENKASDSHLQSKLSVEKVENSGSGNLESLTKKSGSFLKEEANSLTKTLYVTDSNVQTLENTGSEPGPKEEPTGSETKRKRKRNKKNKQESPLVDENKASDSHLESKLSVEKVENSGSGNLESLTKSKRTNKRKRNKAKLGDIENGDINLKSNVKDNDEAGNKNMRAETQIIDGKDLRKEDLMYISEAVKPKHTNSTCTESDLKRKKSEALLVQKNCISLPTPQKKLLILDLNGILVDVIQGTGKLKLKPDIMVNGKGVFKRPFCDEFIDFCLSKFDVAIWSSRKKKNVKSVVDFLMGKKKRQLVFCWNREMCTITKFKTLEDKDKPLVLKELKIIWDKLVSWLPWKKGKYDESNTLLLDDSPYKALRNPANTAIFPYAYKQADAEDRSLARGGDIRRYLERLAAAENVQKFVEQNPFGQPAITERDPHWDFYSQI